MTTCNIFEESVLLSMRFPQKLWKIVNECDSGAIHWGNKGRTILLDYKKFQDQYLNCQVSVFKTKNITSFIRQLNLYGFRKVTSHNRDPLCNAYNPDVHEFLHEHFQSGRTDLLSRVSRKAGSSKGKSICKPFKRDTTKEISDFKKKPIGSRLLMCQLALTKALEKASCQYRRERCYWETEDPLADIANSNSQDAVSELFGFDFNSIPNAEASMEWINRNSALLSSSFKMADEASGSFQHLKRNTDISQIRNAVPVPVTVTYNEESSDESSAYSGMENPITSDETEEEIENPLGLVTESDEESDSKQTTTLDSGHEHTPCILEVESDDECTLDSEYEYTPRKKMHPNILTNPQIVKEEKEI